MNNTIRRLLGASILVIFPLLLSAQEKEKIYDTSLDGMEQIEKAIKIAASEGKHVFIQVGGNWCPWCIKFHHFTNEDPEIKKIISDNFVTVKLNYSPENKNEEAMNSLGKPGRFGYPVFVILDQEGKRIHTQDSGLLEVDKSYDKRKVMTFLKGWSPGAF